MTTKTKKPKAPRKPRVKPVFRTFFIDDEGGNKIRIMSNDKTIILTLLLKGDYPRKIGVVTKSTKTLVLTRKRDSHLFLKGNAYGFCWYVLEQVKYADYIRLSDEITNWKIPISWMKEKGNGFFLQFKEQNFEVQKFFPLRELEQFEVKPKENRRF